MSKEQTNSKDWDARKLSPKAQEAIRIRAIKTYLEENKTQKEVAELFGVGRSRISYWLKLY
jgi:transposase